MAAHGYLVYVLRAARPHVPRALRMLSAVGPEKNIDLLDAIETHLMAQFERYISVPKRGEGFRVRNVSRYGRSLRLKINKGPEGAPGETYDIETAQQQDTTHTTAMLSELRASIYVPPGSYYGLLFVERHGLRNLKELIRTQVILPLSVETQTAIRMEHFAPYEDWKRELRGKQVLRISESLAVRDSASDASTPDDTTVKVSVEGLAVTRLSEPIKDFVLDRIERATQRFKAEDLVAELDARKYVERTETDELGQLVSKRIKASSDAFTMQDEEEYKQAIAAAASLSNADSGELHGILEQAIPLGRESLESRRFDVALGDDQPRKTFVIEGNALPQFVYETSGRLVDELLFRAWDGQAQSLFRFFGVELELGWLNREAVDE